MIRIGPGPGRLEKSETIGAGTYPGALSEVGRSTPEDRVSRRLPALPMARFLGGQPLIPMGGDIPARAQMERMSPSIVGPWLPHLSL